MPPEFKQHVSMNHMLQMPMTANDTRREGRQAARPIATTWNVRRPAWIRQPAEAEGCWWEERT